MSKRSESQGLVGEGKGRVRVGHRCPVCSVFKDPGLNGCSRLGCRKEGRWWRSTELGERRFGVRDRRYPLTSHEPVSGLDLILGREGHG